MRWTVVCVLATAAAVADDVQPEGDRLDRDLVDWERILTPRNIMNKYFRTEGIHIAFGWAFGWERDAPNAPRRLPQGPEATGWVAEFEYPLKPNRHKSIGESALR